MSTTGRPAIISKPSDSPRKRGMSSDPLEECFPSFQKRDGDNVIQGDNNTWIVLGRDRTPATNVTKSQAQTIDGYGGRGVHAAGAIDIVVGRMSPTPIGNIGGSASENDPGIKMDPIFNTYTDQSLTAYDLGSGGKHSGVIMDAARIYISQTTDIDAAFQLNEGLNNLSPDPLSSPRSAIGMKADEIRIISRQGIKLVTGPLSSKEMVNSQGGDIGAVYGIDLMAANGRTPIDGETSEPLVKGDKLKDALREVALLTSDITGIIATLFITQFAFNIATASHIHPEIVLLGFPGVPAPTLIGPALSYYIAETMGKVLPSLINHQFNVGSFNLNYLTPTFEGYICSRYNSTN